MVDMESIAWRQEYRQEAIKLNMRSKNSHENKDSMETVRDDEFEEIINPMAVKLISNVLQIDNMRCVFLSNTGMKNQINS